MRAKDVMTTPVITVPVGAPVKDVAALLVERRISAVPVVDASGEILGIVSEADLVGLQAVADPRLHAIASEHLDARVPLTAGEVMSVDVITVTEDQDVTSVARLLLERAVKRVPVVSGRRVTGIISRRDIMKVLSRSDHSISVELDERLEHERALIGSFSASVAGGFVTLDGPADEQGRRLAALIARSIAGVTGVGFADRSVQAP